MVFEFEFEQAAKRNEPLPSGMMQADNKAYLSLRALYWAFRNGLLPQEEASMEKRQIVKAWEMDKWFDDLSWHHVRFFRAVEQAVSDYRKERSLSAADRLVDIIDGLNRPWIFEEDGDAEL